MSLKLEYAVLARCRPEHVWSVFQHIEQWPRFDPRSIDSVRWVSGEPWTPGASFEINVARPLKYTLTPRILEAKPPIYLHWKGKGKGVTGEQWFIFTGTAEGTEMRTLQEYSGATVLLLGHKIRQPVLDGIAHLFAAIRHEAEALAEAEAATGKG